MSRKNNKLFLFDLVTAFNNRGDLLINRSLIHNLRKYGQVRVKTSEIPAEFLTQLCLADSEQCKSIFKECVVNFFRTRVYFVGIPGHNFGGASRILPSLIGLIRLFVLRAVFRFRFIKVGNSLGPLPKIVIHIERAKSYVCELYGVRDSDSLDLCENSRVQYFPDLAFISHDLRCNSKYNPAAYYFLSFRSQVFVRNDDDKYLQAVVGKLLEYFRLKHNVEIVIAYQVPSDKQACLFVYEALSRLPDVSVKFIDRVLELTESIEFIQQSKCVFSNRLHVLLPALVGGIPHVAVTDLRRHSKITSLYAHVGAGCCLCDVFGDKPIEIVASNAGEALAEIARTQHDVAIGVMDRCLQ
ncbi:polysaccharide pyruvyl transferase family protein [Rosistilla oblonga]|uniref:polysaccharide pyruvyl transferase family protein n=1 Tax=Rosistilla oblonga TaxID=2527990 RepID=UPI003A96CB3C